MKIRLEITYDNGTSKEIEINGPPTPESMFNLINQLVNSYNVSSDTSSTSSYTVDNLKQHQTTRVQSKQTYNQPPQNEKTNIGETRNFKIAQEEYSRLKNESLTIKERLELFLMYEFHDQWFTSLEVKRNYDMVYGHINLSTVSTYLSRLYREDKLERMGNRNKRQYRIIERANLDDYSINPLSIPHMAL